MVAEGRAGPLQLVDEGDQVLHGRSAGMARSSRVAGGGRRDRDAEEGGAGEGR